ncbi:MAG: diguanylate cyclase [Janthinobacterium lividum]
MSDLQEENGKLLGFLYACPIGLVEVSSDGAISMINPLGMQLLMPLSGMPSLNFFDLMAAYAPELRNFVEAFDAEQGNICEDHRILIRPEKANSGEMKVYACTLVKLGAERYMVSLSDISRQVRQERKLKEAETWFSSLMDGASEFGVAALDSNGKIEAVNQTIVRQSGYESTELIGETLDVLSAPPDASDSLTIEQQIDLASREGWYLHESWQAHKNGTASWCQRLIAVRSEGTDKAVSGYTVVFREAEQRPINVQHLKQMLTKDHLTGTYNRMHFFEVAEKECARRKRHHHPLSLIAIDVDSFKQVNDTHGHSRGDDVLKAFARRCMSLLHPNQTMARIGGEEFAILLPSTSLADAMELAEQLRSAIADEAIDAQGIALDVTGSFGCAELQMCACTLPALMEAADSALYEAKRTGRNKVVANLSA